MRSLGYIALVFFFEFSYDLKPGQFPRSRFSMMLEGYLREHYSRTVNGQSGSRMIRSKNSGADLSCKASHISFVGVAEGVKIFMEECVEHIGVDVASVLRQTCYLVQEATVHHDEVRPHLMKRANVVWKVREA